MIAGEDEAEIRPGANAEPMTAAPKAKAKREAEQGVQVPRPELHIISANALAPAPLLPAIGCALPRKP
jgi:hypothetical protein